jgi:hypothetical protein
VNLKSGYATAQTVECQLLTGFNPRAMHLRFVASSLNVIPFPLQIIIPYSYITAPGMGDRLISQNFITDF